MSTIDRYLTSYIRRRRQVALLRAIFLAATFAMIWALLCRWWLMGEIGLWVGAVLIVAIIARPFYFLFQRYDAVAVAIEIESAEPMFDQRLITVVSQPNSSPLTDHLQEEMAPILQQNAAALVRWQPLLLPALMTIGVACVYCALLHQLRHISR